MSEPAVAARAVLEIHCADAVATVALGRRVGALLRGGDVVALCGDLGAGKTTLVQGIVAGLGSSDRVTSPTFTLVNEYSAPGIVICHVDLYRLAEGGEPAPAAVDAQAATLGLDDLLGAPDAIVLVEWADLAGALLPGDHLVIRLGGGEGDGRQVQLEAAAAGTRAREILAALAG
jgi:tRNA threonylcarbamoyladenosine biosynthesis protein TsaE